MRPPLESRTLRFHKAGLPLGNCDLIARHYSFCRYVLLQDSYYTDFEEDNPPPFPSFLPDPEEDLESKSFDECQLRAKSKYKYHLDYAHPTGGPPIT